MAEKALNKTTKSQFDLQLDMADKKHGVSFVLIHGSTIEYIHIPTTREQKFHYFYNPSHLTADERKRMLLGQRPVIKTEDDDLDP